MIKNDLGIKVFNRYADEFDKWFDRNWDKYQAEVNALKRLVPSHGYGLEIGVGSGRFAQPLGIKFGIDPSLNMLQIAKIRGITVCQAYGERLPFQNAQFDHVTLITVVCFVADISSLLCEVKRVIKKGGYILNAFIDKNTDLGRLYQARKNANKYYRAAHFHSPSEMLDDMINAGFSKIKSVQTIMGDQNENEIVLEGFGKGSFVVLCAKK